MTALGPFLPPLPPVPLIGRQQEAATLRAALLGDGPCLVTLVGPPGVGKTLLAMHAAHALAGHFADGAIFVPLDSIQDAALVPATVARALGVREQGGRTLADSVTEALAAKRLLLVLDNFEHVIAAAAFVATLLSRCAGLTVLATSRTPLHLRAEQQTSVEPLPTVRRGPGAGSRPADEVDFSAVTIGPAEALFEARARAVRPAFVLTSESMADVNAICTALDGLPLAIELAAARVALLSPHEIVERLTSRLALLVDGYRDLPERHRTLRAAIDWSYALLSVEEQRVFRLLGAFAGGGTREALEAVFDGVSSGTTAPSALDLVGALANQSLVRRTEDRDGTSRYRMLETIREHAVEQLEAAGKAETTRLQLAAWYAALAELADAKLSGPEQVHWLHRLDAEHDNLRAVLQWALDRDQVTLGLRLAGALGRFWRVRGHLTEGRQWLDRMLAGANGAPLPLRAAALDAAAAIAGVQGHRDDERRFAQQALALYQDAGDERGISVALHRLGATLSDGAAYLEATAYLEESLAIARRLGDAALIRPPLYNLGQIDLSHEQPVRARERFCEALALAQTAADAGGIASIRTALGFAARQDRNLPEAKAEYTEALRLRRDLDDRVGIANTLRLLADLASATGDFDAARAQAAESLAIAVEIGNTWGVVSAYDVLTTVTRKQGDLRAAWQFARLALRAARDLGDMRRMIGALGEWSAVAAVAGEGERAIRAYAASEAGREAIGFHFGAEYEAEMEQLIGTLRDRLGDRAFTEVWATGAALSIGEAIDDALAGAASEVATTPDAERRTLQTPTGSHPLTPRETEVLRLLAAGHSNREIAERLVVSRRTVDHHLTALYAKLGARGRVDATAYAIEHGLGDAPHS